MASVRYSFKNACKHFGIDPDEADAAARLIQSLREADGNKKKRGPKQKWNAERHIDFWLDAMMVTRGRGQLRKKQWAELLVARYPEKYKNPERVRGMFSNAHLRDIYSNEEKKNKFRSEIPSREQVISRLFDRYENDARELPERERRPRRAMIKLFRAGHEFATLLGWSLEDSARFTKAAFKAIVDEDKTAEEVGKRLASLIRTIAPKAGKEAIRRYIAARLEKGPPTAGVYSNSDPKLK
jgi:hypothetical protein